MSRPPMFRKKDTSHKSIADAFVVAGCSVSYIQRIEAGLPDLVVGFMGRDHLVEAKTPKKTRKPSDVALSEAQQAFAASWRGSPVRRCQTAQEAFEFVSMWRRESALALEAARALRDRQEIAMKLAKSMVMEGPATALGHE